MLAPIRQQLTSNANQVATARFQIMAVEPHEDAHPARFTSKERLAMTDKLHQAEALLDEVRRMLFDCQK